MNSLFVQIQWKCVNNKKIVLNCLSFSASVCIHTFHYQKKKMEEIQESVEWVEKKFHEGWGNLMDYWYPKIEPTQEEIDQKARGKKRSRPLFISPNKQKR